MQVRALDAHWSTGNAAGWGATGVQADRKNGPRWAGTGWQATARHGEDGGG